MTISFSNSVLISAVTLALLLPQPGFAREACHVAKGQAGKGKEKLIPIAVIDLGIQVDGIPRKFVQFATTLPVTTDGAPNSYNAADPTTAGGLNTVCNAVPAYQLTPAGTRGPALSCQETLKQFRLFRDANWVVPKGIELDWQPGLKATSTDENAKPCVFSSGPNKGYIASETRLKNGLDGDKGECEINDQVNPLDVYGVTIQWGNNFIRQSGVQLGDLALVRHTRGDGTRVTLAAVVVDSGGGNAAMGSVALNAALIGNPGPFKTHAAVNALALSDKTKTVVTIIPGSFGFQLKRPFENAGINSRAQALALKAGYSSVQSLLESVDACAGGRAQ